MPQIVNESDFLYGTVKSAFKNFEKAATASIRITGDISGDRQHPSK